MCLLMHRCVCRRVAVSTDMHVHYMGQGNKIRLCSIGTEQAGETSCFPLEVVYLFSFYG